MAEIEKASKDTMQDGKNPTAGFQNPFYRNREKDFRGPELTIDSPYASTFDEGYTRKDGSNTMVDVLKEQAPASAKNTNPGKKGGKK